jgi:hypothetical protein
MQGTEARGRRFAEIDGLTLERDLPRRRARHVEQVVDQPRKVLRLPIDDLSQSCRDLRAAALSTTIEHSDGVRDGAERVA